ncbi:hypothetical protein [Desulfovibrio sp.]
MAAIHAHEAWALRLLANSRAKTIVPPCTAISVPYVKNFPISGNAPFFREKEIIIIILIKKIIIKIKKF